MLNQVIFDPSVYLLSLSPSPETSQHGQFMTQNNSWHGQVVAWTTRDTRQLMTQDNSWHKTTRSKDRSRDTDNSWPVPAMLRKSVTTLVVMFLSVSFQVQCVRQDRCFRTFRKRHCWCVYISPYQQGRLWFRHCNWRIFHNLPSECHLSSVGRYKWVLSHCVWLNICVEITLSILCINFKVFTQHTRKILK